MRPAIRLALFLIVPLPAAMPASAVTITVLNADGPGEGFNDPTPVAPLPGNSGTTLGQQRLNIFKLAALYWSTTLQSSVPIVVHAQMNPLSCTPEGALLGFAGPTDAFVNFPHAPRADTLYPSALANALAGTDLDPATPEIEAEFNSALDTSACEGLGWYYGFGGPTPPGAEAFFATVLHELAHGLGFLTFVNLETGARLAGFDDAFMVFLEDHGTGKSWRLMSDGERFDAARDPGALHWTGPNVVASSAALSAGRHPSGHVRMFAPADFMEGSSVAHWDTVLVPDEIMEPFATPNPDDVLTTRLLQDIGWPLQTTPGGSCVRNASTACLQSGRFEVKVDWQTASSQGAGQVMSFGGQRTENDESVFWWFFNAANFEMGIKVLNACGLGGNYWVFLSGLTDQGWTVHVRDTQTGATKTYSNPLGHLSSTFADTSAFNCQ